MSSYSGVSRKMLHSNIWLNMPRHLKKLQIDLGNTSPPWHKEIFKFDVKMMDAKASTQISLVYFVAVDEIVRPESVIPTVTAYQHTELDQHDQHSKQLHQPRQSFLPRASTTSVNDVTYCHFWQLQTTLPHRARTCHCSSMRTLSRSTRCTSYLPQSIFNVTHETDIVDAHRRNTDS